MKKSLFVSATLWLGLAFVFFGNVSAQTVTEGALKAVGAGGKSLGNCPLKHTDVKAEISGFLARTRVTQEFENNFAEKIEAVYVFPLSNKAAVDEMAMTVGSRVVKSRIMRREEARDVYETAKNNGQAAALLDQERANIFTQSVANILPGERVKIEISLVETLKYEAGTYEFVFPTVVAPRYIPAQVSDANKISPPVALTRAGHDISIEVNLDAGVPIESIESKSHQIETNRLSATRAVVRLKNEKEIPNKDFILRYDVSGKKIADAVLTHRSERGGFFTLILQPPDDPPAADVTPKEIVFVLDTSGSMSGFPIEKAKEAMKLALDGLYPNDTFNLITFAGDTAILFPEPVAATPENLEKARQFLESRSGSGGTEMMKAIKAALDPSDSTAHVRIVCFMTDGMVGNEAEIIAEVQRHPNARVFSFGIGGSVNRLLLDKIAVEGRGEAEFVSLSDDGSAAAKRFHERVRAPLLTDVAVDWNNLPVADVYPQKTQDLFSAKPVVLHGRFTAAGSGTIRLRGKQAGREIVREITVKFPERETAHDTLATLWARSRVEDLTKQDYENKKPEIKEAITNLGLEFRLLTPFTSFVAVEELVTTEGGQPRRVEVPVELPEGVSAEGVGINARQIANLPQSTRFASALSSGLVNASVASTVEVTSDAAILIDTTESGVKTIIRPNERDYRSGGGSARRKSENSFVIDGQETVNFSTGAINKNNPAPASYLTGKALKLSKPVFPANQQWDGSDGSVGVAITVNEAGNVVSAKAETGNQILRAASEQAARGSIFKPVEIGGKPIQFIGAIIYNFALENKKPRSSIELGNFAVKPTPEQQKRIELKAKTSQLVFALIEQTKNAAASQSDFKFVKNGRAEIRVYLSDKTPAAIEQLKKIGFEIALDPTTAKFVIGRIAVEKLAELAKLPSVTFIAPQFQTN